MSLILSGTNGLSDVDGSAATPAIRGTDTDTGIFFPAANTLAFSTNGTEDARFDPSGNFGLGVTPSAWSGYGVPVIEAPAGGTFVSAGNGNIIGSNWYYAASNFTYKTTNAASYYYQVNGQHRWFTAASGTAGNAITFNQAMTLTAGGSLGIGTTSPAALLDVSYDAETLVQVKRTTTTTGAAFLRFNNGGGNYYLGPDSSAGNRAFASGGAAYGFSISVEGSYPIVFGTQNVERARIDSSGCLLVGTTSKVGTPQIMTVASNTTAGMHINGSSATVNYGMTFYYNSGQTGQVSWNTTTTTYATSSDYRLKENIAPMTGALATVAALKPCTYTWKADGSSGQGFIAHELQTVVPDAVVGEKDAVDEDGNIKPQSIDTSFLVATLTAAIQEQQAIIEQLQADVAALKAKA